jgi:hypothetical protein
MRYNPYIFMAACLIKHKDNFPTSYLWIKYCKTESEYLSPCAFSITIKASNAVVRMLDETRQ